MSEDQVENSEQVQTEPVINAPKKSRTGLIFGVVNFVFIAAVAGGGYYLFQGMEDKQNSQRSNISQTDMRGIEASKQLNGFQAQIAAMQSQIATFGKDMAGKDNHFTKTLADFSALQSERQETTKKTLMADITQVKRQLGKTRGDWLVADAEYLLSIANQRLQLVGDVKTSIMALEAADQRLRESGDTAAFKVRTQIAKEIEILRGVNTPDIVALYASIQLLKDKVPTLELILPYAGKALEPVKVKPKKGEQDVLDSALEVLDGYITIRHIEQAVPYILTKQEASFIRQRLGIKLEMIKIALVQQKEALFQSSIADAKQWLKRSFRANPSFSVVSGELDKLNGVHLDTMYPDISISLKLLKDITKFRIEVDKGLPEFNKKPVVKKAEPVAVPTSAPVPIAVNTEAVVEQVTQ